MALWLRRDGSLLCAARYKPRTGDKYIDDREHYEMAAIRKEIMTIDGKIWLRKEDK